MGVYGNYTPNIFLIHVNCSRLKAAYLEWQALFFPEFKEWLMLILM